MHGTIHFIFHFSPYFHLPYFTKFGKLGSDSFPGLNSIVVNVGGCVGDLGEFGVGEGRVLFEVALARLRVVRVHAASPVVILRIILNYYGFFKN